MLRTRTLVGYYVWALIGCPPFGILAAVLVGSLAALPLLVVLPSGLAVIGAHLLAVGRRHAVLGAIGAVIVAIGGVAALFAFADLE
jgi:hypothetical protein